MRNRLDIPLSGNSTGCSGAARRLWSARSGRPTRRRWSDCGGPPRPGTRQHVLLAGPALSLEAATRCSEVDYDARIAFGALVSDEMVRLASYDRPDARVPAADTR